MLFARMCDCTFEGFPFRVVCRSTFHFLTYANILASKCNLSVISIFQRSFRSLFKYRTIVLHFFFPSLVHHSPVHSFTRYRSSFYPLIPLGRNYFCFFCFSVLCRSSPALRSVAQLAHFCTLPCALLHLY